MASRAHPNTPEGSWAAGGTGAAPGIGHLLRMGSGVGWGWARRANGQAGLWGAGHWQGLPWGSGKAWEAEGLIKTIKTSKS